MNCWEELFARKRPVVGLSPMDGVTDAAMRYMSAKYGRKYPSTPVTQSSSRKQESLQNGKTAKPDYLGLDVIFTEFVSVDALHYATGERRERLLRTFIRARDVEGLHSRSEGLPHSGSDGAERWPYEIAQVFGRTPDYFREAAELIESLGFDGIDINMGCPAHKVEENGSGAGLIRTPELAQEIILAVKSATKLPVSVKTRIGVQEIVVEEWMETLMETQPANISLHGRTLRQLYQGSADWEAIGRAARVVHKHGGHILGNGDISSMQDARIKIQEYSVDGVLIGRAAGGNPGIFLPAQAGTGGSDPSQEQRIAWMLEHAKIFEKIFSDNFMPMRKHLAWYCKGFEGAVEIRSKLMLTNSAQEVEEIIKSNV